jgi:hypothetical protein
MVADRSSLSRVPETKRIPRVHGKAERPQLIESLKDRLAERMGFEPTCPIYSM